jgi:hypothetical protein
VATISGVPWRGESKGVSMNYFILVATRD